MAGIGQCTRGSTGEKRADRQGREVACAGSTAGVRNAQQSTNVSLNEKKRRIV